MRSAVLIYNPSAGRGRGGKRVAGLVEALRSGGYDAQARPTPAPGAATGLAREAAAAGVEAVFAYGGDGTLREAAAGLLGSTTVLGFIPGGTVNVMTLALGLPKHPLAAVSALGGATVRELDVGLCNDEAFLMQASAGVDAELIRRLSPRLKRLLGTGSSVPAGLGAFGFHRYPRIELSADGEELEGSLVVVSNIQFYSSWFVIQPEARPDDGELDLIVFRGKGRLATAGFARDLLFGRHLRRPDVEVRRVREVELRGPAGLPIQIDGDAMAGGPPAHIRLAPERLRMLAL